jgi:hypothetical protein
MQSPRPVVKNMAIDGPFIDLGKFDHDRSLFSRSLESWFSYRYREIIPFYGPTIQVSEIKLICPEP